MNFTLSNCKQLSSQASSSEDVCMFSHWFVKFSFYLDILCGPKKQHFRKFQWIWGVFFTMKELQDLLDAFPYWLLIVLPVFIALSPYNPVCDASELNFPIHRLAQYEISGNRFGSKAAAISIEARTANAANTNLLRKIVIARLQGKPGIG